MDPSTLFQDSWPDDNRMRSLYAEFRSKHLNPEGWNTKLNEWIGALNKLCLSERKIVFSLENMKLFFERDNNQPQCLNTVLSEMESQGLVIRMNNFQDTLKTKSWVSWGLDWFLKKPISWGFSIIQKSVFGASQTMETMEYVHLTVLNNMCALVLDRLELKIETENIKTMVDVKVFHASCRDLVKDFKVFFLVLTHLEAQDKIVMFKEEENNYIKVKQAQNEKASLNETDIGIIKLQKALQQIETEINKFEQDMDVCKEEAKIALRNKNRPKAEALLRKKHKIEKQLQEKQIAANNVEIMLHQLESSFTNTDVINALKAGTNAQKKIAAAGFNIKEVDQTMDDIEETFDEHLQVSDILSRKMEFGLQLDDDELEEELDELLELDRLNQISDRSKPNIKSPVIDDHGPELSLPNVPDDSPAKINKIATAVLE